MWSSMSDEQEILFGEIVKYFAENLSLLSYKCVWEVAQLILETESERGHDVSFPSYKRLNLLFSWNYVSKLEFARAIDK